MVKYELLPCLKAAVDRAEATTTGTTPAIDASVAKAKLASTQQLLSITQQLMRILENIASTPTEEKYRRIRIASRTFQGLAASLHGNSLVFGAGDGRLTVDEAEQVVVAYFEHLGFVLTPDAAVGADGPPCFIVLPPTASLQPIQDGQYSMFLLSERLSKVVAFQNDVVVQCELNALKKQDEQEQRQTVAALGGGLSKPSRGDPAGMLSDELRQVLEALPFLEFQAVYDQHRRFREDKDNDSSCAAQRCGEALPSEGSRLAFSGLVTCKWTAAEADDLEVLFQQRYEQHAEAARAARTERQRRRKRTGAVVKELSASKKEQQLTATSLIQDIGGLMEVHWMLSGAVGYQSEWRKETKRLLEKYHQDEDIGSLHHTKAEWQARVNALKAQGRNLLGTVKWSDEATGAGKQKRRLEDDERDE